MREKKSALRDEIPAALTLNTYYTCYAIDKFILYLYRDRIYDVLYVILYLYGLLHTLSPKLPFRRAAERTWVSARKAQESKKKRASGRKREKTDTRENEESANSSQRRQHDAHINPFLFGRRYRLVLEDFRIRSRIFIERNRRCVHENHGEELGEA